MGFKAYVSWMTIVGAALLAGACSEPGEDEHLENYRCLNADQLPADTSKIPRLPMPKANGSIRPQGYVETPKIWRYQRKDRLVPVCWEPEGFTEENASYRALVKEKIEGTWGEALKFKPAPEREWTRFVGWEKCGGPHSDGIRIKVSADPGFRAGTTFIGAKTAGLKDGMALRHQTCFTNACLGWAPDAVQDPKYMEKIRADALSYEITGAVHEFGHALGLEHEHQREDTPEACLKNPIIVNEKKPEQVKLGKGNLVIGDWDEDSVMNYCKKKKVPQLSAGDIATIRAAYYYEYFDFDCLAGLSPAAKTMIEGAGIQLKPGVNSDQRVKVLPPDSPDPAPTTPSAAGAGR